MVKWEKFFEDKIKEIAEEKAILDVGGGFPFQKGMGQFKHLFKNCDYKTMDLAPEYKPDIVGDIHNIPMENGSVDAIICKAVLKHVYDPVRAVNEMHRILKKGGKMLFYAPFLYAYHHNEIYDDYYRYTEDGLRYLFREFSSIEICPVRGNLETLLYLTPVRRSKILTAICRFFDRFFSGKQASGYYLFAIK